MKKSVFFALLSVVLLASCKIEMNGWNKIEPSKNIVKNEYKMDAFDQMEVDLTANVKFVQGKEGDYRVVMSCPDNYVELIGFGVENDGELEVHFLKDNINIDPDHVDITVYAPALRKLENRGVASVEVDRLKGDRLEVENSGVGGIYISGLELVDIEAECSGVGSVELSGQVVRADMECSGVGSIKAEELKAKSVKAEVSGVGGITCFASENIEAEVSGVGSLKYGGQPHQKNLRRTGVGDFSEL
jgi:hypothetical protein